MGINLTLCICTRVVTDKNKNIVKEIIYDTYGNILSETNPSFTVAFGFGGGLRDRDTNLVHFGYREYEPYTGKWTAKDPIDFGGGDSNLYGYVLGDPVGFVDPSGLILAALAPISLPLAAGLAGAITGAVCEIANGGDFDSVVDAGLTGGLIGVTAGAVAESGLALATPLTYLVDITGQAINGLIGASQ